MIHSTDNVPKIYNTSRDYQAILRLLDLLINVEKSDTDNLVSLVNADMCPSKYLPLLASYVGYDYDYSLSYETNRLIIKYFPKMIRLRGSEEGIVLACAVAINSALEKETISGGSMDFINVIYDTKTDPDKPMLKVFINTDLSTNSKLFDLIEVVRPVGMAIQIKESIAVRNKDSVEISDAVTVSKMAFSVGNRNKVMPMNDGSTDINEVGFGESNEQTP